MPKKATFCRASEKNEDPLLGQIQDVVAAQMREYQARAVQGRKIDEATPKSGSPPEEVPSGGTWKSDIVCFNCGSRGHCKEVSIP